MSKPQQPEALILSGYRPGIIGRVTEMHARYYAEAAGFGLPFEVVVSGGLTEFSGRLDRPMNAIWSVVLDHRIAGSIAVDGEDMGNGLAHLRWFIVDHAARGTGAGKKLLRAALDFVDARGFEACHLWTFSGLLVARHLYETHGFALAEERHGSQWGSEVLEQRFVRSKPL